MENTLETKTHCWKGLTEYNPDQEDIVVNSEMGIEGTFNIVNKLKVNEFFTVEADFRIIHNINYFEDYIDNLKSFGLDIGKGECEYGYKMPLPEKGETRRKLIIFRRR